MAEYYGYAQQETPAGLSYSLPSIISTLRLESRGAKREIDTVSLAIYTEDTQKAWHHQKACYKDKV
jgi:hypothetical protein